MSLAPGSPIGGSLLNVLITGMSGTGKSSVVAALRRSGHRAIDLDEDGWSVWMPCEGNPTGANPGHDWVWDQHRLTALLREARDEPLFIAGCAPNMGHFTAEIDRIVVLHAPVDTLLERVRTRPNNAYGKCLAEAERIKANQREIEPRLRQIADYEVETTRPLAEVVDEVAKAAT